jgi:hypothetical protein
MLILCHVVQQLICSVMMYCFAILFCKRLTSKNLGNSQNISIRYHHADLHMENMVLITLHSCLDH